MESIEKHPPDFPNNEDPNNPAPIARPATPKRGFLRSIPGILSLLFLHLLVFTITSHVWAIVRFRSNLSTLKEQ